MVLAALSVSSLFAFLLTVVGVGLLVRVVMLLMAKRSGAHSHAFSDLGMIAIVCVICALAASVTTLQATGTSILGLFGI